MISSIMGELLHPREIFESMPGPVMIDDSMPLYADLHAVKLDLSAITNDINSVNPGQEIIITTAENPTTGYSWQQQIMGEAAEAVSMIETSYAPPDTNLVGAGGVRTFKYLVDAAANSNGNFNLEFVDARPWEMQENGPFDPTKVVQFTIA